MFLAEWEPLHEIAAIFPQWEPGSRGRPPDLPPAAHVLFGIMYLECGSGDRTEAFFDDAATWQTVRRSLAARYPGYRGLRPDAQPITRSEFWRFRQRHAVLSDMLADLRVAFRCQAVVLAADNGCFDLAQGSLSQPATDNMVVGDGTVLRCRYKATSNTRQRNPDSGALEPVRHDPDAEKFTTGDGETPYGLKVGLVSVWTEHEMERYVLDVFSVSNQPDRGEAAEAIRSLDSLADLIPDLHGVAWDMAFRGKHNKRLRERGLIDVVKVPKQAAGAGEVIPAPLNGDNTRKLGHVFTLADGTAQEIKLYTFDGHPHLEAVAEGTGIHVALAGGKRRRSKQRARDTDGRNRYRMYRDYAIPDDPRIAKRLRGATGTIRLTENDDDRKLGYKRCEHLRPVTIHDGPEWDRLYSLRPRAESLNRWIKGHFADQRAPAVGMARNLFMLFCAGLLNNAKAALAHDARLRQAA